jgi:hypothetical protein
MFLAIDSTNAVFPIAGLAAMIIKSLGCHPELTYLVYQNLLQHRSNPLPAISSILFFGL